MKARAVSSQKRHDIYTIDVCRAMNRVGLQHWMVIPLASGDEKDVRRIEKMLINRWKLNLNVLGTRGRKNRQGKGRNVQKTPRSRPLKKFRGNDKTGPLPPHYTTNITSFLVNG